MDETNEKYVTVEGSLKKISMMQFKKLGTSQFFFFSRVTRAFYVKTYIVLRVPKWKSMKNAIESLLSF